MSIPMPPSSPTRPEFGHWADRPRSEWTEAQAQEFDEKWAEFKRQSEAFLNWVGELPGRLNAVTE